MSRIAYTAAFILGALIASPASAQVVITQSKALAGNVTPGDTAGYPISISQPGAYILGSNLVVPANVNGISVTANNVDIDMKGFLLTGGGAGFYGVVSTYGESRIRNGVINRFRYSGIYLRNHSWTIEDMKIARNGGMGIDATGAGQITLQNSLVATNGRNGIDTGNSGLFRNNQISNNAAIGIGCDESCHAEGNIIDLNEYGIVFKSGMAIGNTNTRNIVYGISDNIGNIDFGYSNNMFVNNNNNTAGQNQLNRVVEIHPNTCIGKPC